MKKIILLFLLAMITQQTYCMRRWEMALYEFENHEEGRKKFPKRRSLDECRDPLRARVKKNNPAKSPKLSNSTSPILTNPTSPRLIRSPKLVQSPKLTNTNSLKEDIQEPKKYYYAWNGNVLDASDLNSALQYVLIKGQLVCHDSNTDEYYFENGRKKIRLGNDQNAQVLFEQHTIFEGALLSQPNKNIDDY